MKILVTRPRLFADSLCNSIKAIGATPMLFPTIEILANPISDSLKQNILELEQYHCLIFNSRPAVIYGMQAMKSLLDLNLLSNLYWIAQGPGTKAELNQAGIANVSSPSIPPYESESLLELLPLQKLQGKRIALFRGNDGRTLLLNTLIQGGAQVSSLEVYRRWLPGKESSLSATIDHTNLPDAVIACSSNALKNLSLLIEAKTWQALKQRPFILIGKRMESLAIDLGIKSIILSKGPSDLELIQTVRTLKEALL